MELKIPAMTCGGCVRAVTKAIHDVSPGATVQADVPGRRVLVSGTADAAAVHAALEAAGFPAERH
jgi:copper chaperone